MAAGWRASPAAGGGASGGGGGGGEAAPKRAPAGGAFSWTALRTLPSVTSALKPSRSSGPRGRRVRLQPCSAGLFCDCNALLEIRAGVLTHVPAHGS